MFQEVKTYFESLGWLANMLALMPIIATAFGIYTKRGKIMAWFKKRKYLNIADHLQTHLTNYSFKTAEVKLAIVDDNPSDFPLDYLKSTFGRVDVFEKISLSEASRLANYDLVFLDMMGVVKEDSKYGGASIDTKNQRIARCTNCRSRIGRTI